MSEVTIQLHLEPIEGGGYVATSPDVPGLVAQGRSMTETVEIAQGLVRKIVESCIEHGDPIPDALSSLPATPGIELHIPVGMP
ncbi:MAG TPA: type II toxin-antitoxin system HicB family antitoxin [Candidatus Hydrogenedentes bacterium]|nr:type II toxin-antitoxin system HicB family antitoxin [Candidatus Hydrogenedentota bacterium]